MRVLVPNPIYVILYVVRKRSESLKVLQHTYANLEGPEPKQIDIPQRRTSVTRPGGGSLVGLEAGAASSTTERTTPPESPSREELERRESEAELLESAVGLGSVSHAGPLPQKRVCGLIKP